MNNAEIGGGRIINSNQKFYYCGSLKYTKAGLFALTAWMLWGDFCYTVMEAVVPSILPLKLKDLGCSNLMLGLIMSTIPGILGMTICPYVSFKSDRYRSRWGRRIPFIIVTMPFLCISLILLGWSHEISSFVRHNITFLCAYSPEAVTITLIAIFMIMFQFFNDFVASVFNYLFNDVVPSEFLSRFMGLFRIAGTIAGAFYNYFIFKYAESNMKEIFTGAAILYFIGFGIMCLKVKEGKYPPIEIDENLNSKGVQAFKTFFSESFGHKFYWLIFLGNTLLALSSSIACFNIFFQKEMGLSLEHIGKLAAVMSIAVLAATYFAAMFIDRWHPVRIMAYASVFNIITVLMNWVWIFVTLPGEIYFWLCLGSNMTSSFYSALITVANTPRQMRLFPQSRYGQFCSAQAMLKWFCLIGGGIAAGLFIDTIKYFCNGSDFAYRFNFMWSFIFISGSSLTGIYIYLNWLKMGGDKHYHPPAPWSPSGIEEIPIVKTIGPSLKWLTLALSLFDCIMLISLFMLLPMMYWMYHIYAFTALKYFSLLIFPFSLIAYIYWRNIKRRILGDINRVLNSEAPLNGIPHHGMFIIVALKYLLALIIWVFQVFVTLSIHMESASIVFGIANVVTNFMLISMVHMMMILERGHSTVID